MLGSSKNQFQETTKLPMASREGVNDHLGILQRSGRRTTREEKGLAQHGGQSKRGGW